MTSRFLILLLALVLVAGLVSCFNNPSGTRLGRVELRLTDAPGDFDAINVVVDEVAVHRSDAAGEDDAVTSAANAQGWEVVSSEPQTFDLLTLQNGTFTSLASASVPAGHYTQIRLRVAPGSTVVVNGVSHPLVIPSGLQSGIKLVSGFDVPAGGLVQLMLDFDGARSIVLAGDGTYHLKPTIQVARAN